jgi:hypothetical protein
MKIYVIRQGFCDYLGKKYQDLPRAQLPRVPFSEVQLLPTNCIYQGRTTQFWACSYVRGRNFFDYSQIRWAKNRPVLFSHGIIIPAPIAGN